ncbi:MAG: prepilin-type N-terminal cleavage/methylation domain-containing protein [Verrucomicrobiota bacterium]
MHRTLKHNLRPSSQRPHRQSGFSLIELLVTMAVALIVMTALMQSMVSSLDSWTKQDKQFSSQREARAALRLLADDLASLVVIPGGGPLEQDPQAVAGAQPMRFLVQAATATSVSTCRLAFLRTAKRAVNGADSGRGDLQLVLYGVTLSQDGGASGLEMDARSQKLVRRQFSPAETYLRLQGHRVTGQPLVFEDDWVKLETPPENAPAVPAGTPPGPRNAILAHDVIRFDCKALQSLTPGQPQPPVWPLHELPNWLEVTLRVTNRSTGRQLKTAEDWRGEGVLARELTNGTPDVFEDDREVRTFSMRLRLPTLAL